MVRIFLKKWGGGTRQGGYETHKLKRVWAKCKRLWINWPTMSKSCATYVVKYCKNLRDFSLNFSVQMLVSRISDHVQFPVEGGGGKRDDESDGGQASNPLIGYASGGNTDFPLHLHSDCITQCESSEERAFTTWEHYPLIATLHRHWNGTLNVLFAFPVTLLKVKPDLKGLMQAYSSYPRIDCRKGNTVIDVKRGLVHRFHAIIKSWTISITSTLFRDIKS